MRLESFDIRKLESTSDMISIYDGNLTVSFWNLACEVRFNIKKEDAIGKILFDLFPQTKNDYRVQCLRDAIRDGKSFYFNCLPYLFSKGYYTQVILPLRDGDGYGSVLNIVRDLKNTSEVHTKRDLLYPLLKDPVSLESHPHMR